MSITAKTRPRRGRRPSAPLVLSHGDPRHAAWLQHWRNADGVEGATRAAEVERFRRPIEAPKDYPPPSPGVTWFRGDDGAPRFEVPYGTPEFASFVAHEQARRPELAADMVESGKAGRTLRTLARWAPFPGQEG